MVQVKLVWLAARKGQNEKSEKFVTEESKFRLGYGGEMLRTRKIRQKT